MPCKGGYSRLILKTGKVVPSVNNAPGPGVETGDRVMKGKRTFLL